MKWFLVINSFLRLICRNRKIHNFSNDYMCRFAHGIRGLHKSLLADPKHKLNRVIPCSEDLTESLIVSTYSFNEYNEHSHVVVCIGIRITSHCFSCSVNLEVGKSGRSYLFLDV